MTDPQIERLRAELAKLGVTTKARDLDAMIGEIEDFAGEDDDHADDDLGDLDLGEEGISGDEAEQPEAPRCSATAVSSWPSNRPRTADDTWRDCEA